MIVAMLTTLALAFHLVPTPADIKQTPEFALAGYTTGTCSSERDQNDLCRRTVVERPAFDPETDADRPVARVSFIAPLSGKCSVAMTETIDGDTQFVLAGGADVVKGRRAFIRAVLPDLDDLAGDPWAALAREHYRIVVACVQGETALLSSFYQVEVPGAAT